MDDVCDRMQQPVESGGTAAPASLVSLAAQWHSLATEEKETLIDRFSASAIQAVAASALAPADRKTGRKAVRATRKAIRRQAKKLRKAAKADQKSKKRQSGRKGKGSAEQKKS
jgi:hypothetical protein